MQDMTVVVSSLTNGLPSDEETLTILIKLLLLQQISQALGRAPYWTEKPWERHRESALSHGWFNQGPC
jgi:hypothetical protein